MDTQCRQQPISNERADDAGREVADEAVAAAPHDLASQPAGDNADQDDNYETLIRQARGGSSLEFCIWPKRRRRPPI